VASQPRVRLSTVRGAHKKSVIYLKRWRDLAERAKSRRPHWHVPPGSQMPTDTAGRGRTAAAMSSPYDTLHPHAVAQSIRAKALPPDACVLTNNPRKHALRILAHRLSRTCLRPQKINCQVENTAICPLRHLAVEPDTDRPTAQTVSIIRAHTPLQPMMHIFLAKR